MLGIQTLVLMLLWKVLELISHLSDTPALLSFLSSAADGVQAACMLGKEVLYQ